MNHFIPCKILKQWFSVRCNWTILKFKNTEEMMVFNLFHIVRTSSLYLMHSKFGLKLSNACLEFMRLRDSYLISYWTDLKHMCFLNQECDGFTLSNEFKCILHKTATSFHFTGRRISQVGIRKRTSAFPKYCEEEQRLERCKNEPICDRILNCFRKSYFIW